jgi:MOSC domain-containing protein YiiM
MPPHRTLAELNQSVPHIAQSPADNGAVEAIVVRPRQGERVMLEACAISRAGGFEGDAWAQGSWKSTDDGRPHPDAQVCIMNARSIAAIAGDERANWAPAGDNLFIDLDLTRENLPVGQRLRIGTAVIEVTAEPHAGCSLFIDRYGRDAAVFTNTGEGRRLRLRGIYARVVQDGRVAVGDRIMKVV